jgi:hypothetical protein
MSRVYVWVIMVRDVVVNAVMFGTVTTLGPRVLSPDAVTLAKLCVLVFLMSRLLRGGRMLEISKVVPEDRLNAFVREHLFSRDRCRQKRAVDVLSVVAGDRYGRTLRPHVRTIALWRRWWKKHGARLKWDPVLERYIEHNRTLARVGPSSKD